MNKRKLWTCIGIGLILLIVSGAVFCVLRPEYVWEAVQILFSNELN